jgi:Fe-S cluster assembly protein SufD
MVGSDAHKTDTKQTNRTLLLSEEAQVNSTSRLENLAKEVNCSQRTVGRQIDKHAAFYIRSRGLGEAEARRLVILAFVHDMLNRLPLQTLARGVEKLLQPRIDGMIGVSRDRKDG